MRKYLFLLSGIFFLIIIFESCIESNIIEDHETLLNNSTDVKLMDDGTDYYWYNGEKIYIIKNDRKSFVLFRSSKEEIILNSFITKSAVVPQNVSLSSQIKKISDQTDSELLKWVEIETVGLLNIQSDIIYDAPYFNTLGGEEIGLSHLFYVKLLKEEDLTVLKDFALLNNVEIIGNNNYMPLWYTLSCTNNSTGNALELANQFYETGLFDASQPDLMSNDQPECVNDPHFPVNQWNLRNTGQNGGVSGIDVNFCNARSITTGSQSIIVAVLDQGIQLNHPDLNIHPVSYDSETGTSPSRVYGTHGTNCAGFISARTNNSIGVAALAPNSPSMSISNSLAATPDSRQKRADGINFAWRNGASVISNSWSSAVRYTLIDNAISNALSQGRSGRGCVVVFSTGNDSQGSVNYPANSNSDILAVGSISRSGVRSSFSNYGTAVDIVAPGENVCTTTTGSNYVTSISGTSFSCPQAAAVAALVLSVNPNLTQRQVVDIIERTATKVGNYVYTTTSGRTNGTWNNQVGYGLLNAYQAVITAGGNDITYFTNQVISSDYILTGWNIITENITVTNKAKFSIRVGNSLIMNSPFTLSANSEFECSFN